MKLQQYVDREWIYLSRREAQTLGECLIEHLSNEVCRLDKVMMEKEMQLLRERAENLRGSLAPLPQTMVSPSSPKEGV
jgi:hypothetical protein